MTDSQPLSLHKCGRCGKEFTPAFAEAVLCSSCRHYIIRKERNAARREARKEVAAAQLELLWDKSRRSEWDILVIDERGQTVWARDLAHRYRNELDARQRRDWKRAGTTSH